VPLYPCGLAAELVNFRHGRAKRFLRVRAQARFVEVEQQSAHDAQAAFAAFAYGVDRLNAFLDLNFTRLWPGTLGLLNFLWRLSSRLRLLNFATLREGKDWCRRNKQRGQAGTHG
jgi:hypothetical protein